jgi:acyl transferase domain-containing protein/acyl-CoA synthetase (AMP-forming)/AMP-acid ligase II/acyl carrier protein
MTLIGLLQERAKKTPDGLAYSFLSNGEDLETSLTYSSLDTEAKKTAYRLSAKGQPGDRVLLLFQSGTSVLIAFFGVLYAGMIPVPCPAPKRNKADVRFASIFNSAKPTIALVPAELASLAEKWQEFNPSTAPLNYQVISDSNSEIAIESPIDSDLLGWMPPNITGDSIAFLQYTSGSTSAPKGVVVSHENVLQNLAHLDHGWDHDKNSVMVTWLPYFHDMGLIYGLLMPLFRGFPCYIMSPTAFAQKPYRWLKALSDFKGTHTAAPNFAFDLCLNSISDEQRDGLDLRTWSVALNAAETVRLKTIENFNEFFSGSGLSANTICPGFGLAEGTLKITALPKESPLEHLHLNRQQLAAGIISDEAVASENTVAVVGCGYPVADTIVSIVDPESHCLVDNETIGEVWASGPAIAEGYWNNPVATEQNFKATIKNASGNNDKASGASYLRTGDLGFIRDKELFITGRISELIIIHGQNYYPQDIETTVVASDVSLRPDCTAAFRVVVNDEERLVVAQEIKRTHLKNFQLEEVALKVRSALAKEHGLPLQAVLFLKPGTCPKTTSGKIQRHACRQGYLESTLALVGRWDDDLSTETSQDESSTTRFDNTKTANTDSSLGVSAEKLLESIKRMVAQRLHISADSIDIKKPLAFYNLSSIHAVGLAEDLSQATGRQLPSSLLYDFATIAKLVEYLQADTDSLTADDPQELSSSHDPLNDCIAIIGLDCKVPGASNAAAFSDSLFSDADGISGIPMNRWNSSEYYDKRAGAVGKMNTLKGGFIEDIDLFDEGFFGIAAGEAKLIDPQQRLLLEVSWNALENAGISPTSLSGTSTGVFTGISNSDYQRLVFTDKKQLNPWTGTGSALSIASNRLSYFYNLKGPSLAVDTACSSSLTAIHLACNSLRQGESQLAIVSGVNLILSPEWNIALSSAEMLSPDGRCKTFDDSANGYVRSEGCSVVILKKLSDAIKDNNSVLAVIRGTAINQDGQGNGLTAPNSQSQIDVVKSAVLNANIAPETVSYVEAHGTGTPLGDPIEINALQQSLCQNRSVDRPLIVGSVKTNVGHLEAAAGITGLIKVILAMQAKKLPAHRNFEVPNRHVDWDNLAIKIPVEHTVWPVSEQVAGVSSFGFGGTNAHVIVSSLGSVDTASEISQATPVEGVSQESQTVGKERLFCLSAKTKTALEQQRSAMSDWLKANRSADVESLSRTLSLGRDHFDWRLCITGSTTADLIAKLENTSSNFIDADSFNKTVFLFTGQGSQYAGMGKGLYEKEPVFKLVVDEGNRIYQEHFNTDLLNVILSGEGLNETEFSQPAIYLIEVALAELWISKGIKPDAVLGHSVGEYAAATISGVFSIEEGLVLVSRRGQLMQSLPKTGSMVAIFSGATSVLPLLVGHEKTLAIAAINGPSLTVVSGDTASISSVTEQLEKKGIRFSPLNVSHAFHSPLMEPITKAFTEAAKKVSYQRPKLTFISCMTGTSVNEEIACSDYWVEHVTQPVLFEAGLSRFSTYQNLVFIEMGPKPMLSSMGRQFFPKSLAKWAWSIREETQADGEFLEQCASIYRWGLNLDWREVVGSGTMLNSLPNYPFQRRRHWISLDVGATNSADIDLSSKLGPDSSKESITTKRPQFVKERAYSQYRPEWILDSTIVSSNKPITLKGRDDKTEWFLTGDAQSCKYFGAVIEAASEQYTQLFLDNGSSGKIQSGNGNVVFFASKSQSPAESIEDTNALLKLFQRVQEAKSRLKIWVVTSNAVNVKDSDQSEGLFQSTLWGFARSAGLEVPANWAGLIDLPIGLGTDRADYTPKVSEALSQVLLESIENQTEDQQAIRFAGFLDDQNNTGLVEFDIENDNQGFEHLSCRLMEVESRRSTDVIVEGKLGSDWSTTGTWIITGGHGALGLHTAKWLLKKGAQKLVLCSRREPDDKTKREIAALTQTEGEVISVAVDVADYSALAEVMNDINSQGTLEGVIHGAGIGGADALATLTDDSVEAVMNGKMRGGWNLHNLCADLNPNYFICYSSIASVWSSRGQAHYAAANCYLDALCAYRTQKGLPALAVNWGPWNGGGMAEADTLRTLANQGVYGIDPAVALDQLASVMGESSTINREPSANIATPDRQLSQIVICDIDWRILKPLAEVLGKQPFLSQLGVVQTKSEAETFGPQYHQLLALTPLQRRDRLLSLIFDQMASYLGVEAKQLAASGDGFGPKGFVSMGMGSLSGVALKNYLENLLDATFPATLIFDYSNPEELVGFLESSVFSISTPSSETTIEKDTASNDNRDESVAVIGMACRFPGNISSPEEFWTLLLDGSDATSDMPDRWDVEALYCEDQNSPGKMAVKRGGFIDGVENFDAGFFAMTPREAVSLDPQQRLMMEVVWKLFEDAGVIPADLNGSSTGVFIGSTSNDYREMLAGQAREFGLDAYFVTGNTASAAAGRISHLYGLNGPSVALDTACSSSLAAVHMACRSLRSQESSLAIAAGVNLNLSPSGFIALSHAGALSVDGRCKTFDERANGYARSEGCGALLLKLLSDAERDGDKIYAVIEGSAMNQDGRSSGLTVPSGNAQQKVIASALQDAGVTADSIQYLEAHGTGTKLGDPIELNAIASAFHCNIEGARTTLKVGSVKANLGHMESAAGMGSLIKTILSLHKGIIPKQIHFNTPTPHFDWSALNLEVPIENSTWTEAPNKRLAAVSGFGIGGTNVHQIVRGYESTVTGKGVGQRHGQVPKASADERYYVLPISANNLRSLTLLVERYIALIDDNSELSLADLCQAAALSRTHFNCRYGPMASDMTELRRVLGEFSRVSSKAGELDSGLLNGDNLGNSGSINSDGANGFSVKDAKSLSAAYEAGIKVDWKGIFPDRRKNDVLSFWGLPHYPFDRARYWLKLEQQAASPQTDTALNIIKASSSQQRLSLLEYFLIRLVAEVMGVKTQELEREHPGFFQMGMDSIMAIEVIKGIESALEIELYPTAIFDYPSIPELTTFLAGRLSQNVNSLVGENSDEDKNSVVEKETNKVIKASVAVADNKISVNDQIDRLEELLKKI